MSEEEEENKQDAPRKKGQERAKRELEQAPLMLRKASVILFIGAMLPFFSGLKYAASAVDKVGAKTAPFDWKTLLIAKALVLVGGWVLYECHRVRSGEKPNSPLKGLANAHAMAGLVVTSLFWIGSLVMIFMGTGVYVTLADGSMDEVFKLGAIAEVMALMLALFTWTHIYDYEHGGKFNPLVPLLMIGPGLAGVLNLLGIGAAFSNPHSGLGAIGLIGGIIVAAGGGLAIYTMYASIQEAKVQGEAKKAAMREARKAERARQRGAR